MADSGGLRHRAEAAVDVAVFGMAVMPIILAGAVVGAMGLGLRVGLAAAECLVDRPRPS